MMIAGHLGVGVRQVENLHRTGMLPTFRIPRDSALHATAGGLDEWMVVTGGGVLNR